MFSSNSNLSVFSQIFLTLLSYSLGEALHVWEEASEFRVRYEYIFSVCIAVEPTGEKKNKLANWKPDYLSGLAYPIDSGTNRMKKRIARVAEYSKVISKDV